MPTVDETLAAAARHLGAGNPRLAEQLYRQVIQAVPDSARAHCCLGMALAQQGQFDQAVASFQEALRCRPDYPEAHNDLANVLQVAGRLEEAVAHYEQAIRLRPNYPEAHNNLGVALASLGRLDEAVAHHTEALRFNPNNAGIHYNLGMTLAGQHKLDEAIACYRQALELQPTLADAYNTLGIALERQNKGDEAIQSYGRALQLRPGFAEAHNNLGNALKHARRLDEAIPCYRQAVQLQGDFAEAHHNLGIVYLRLGQLDEALECCRQAVKHKPNYPDAYSTMGLVHADQGRFEEALACYDRALALDANHAGTQFNRAVLWLLLGDWQRGWPAYEWRWRTSDYPRLDFRQPRWHGSPLAGKTLLVVAEGGHGDAIHFVRYVPLLRHGGAHVLVQCPPALRGLFAESLGAEGLLVQGDKLPHFDVYVPMQSLPGIFGTTVASVPASIPYLHVNANSVEHWRRQLERLRGFKVGIAWQGNPMNIGDRLRSIPLTMFAPLAQVPGVVLISLQKGPGTEQLRALAGRFPVIDLEGNLGDAEVSFLSIAAIMKNVDLVISCDTAVAHLAGALGVPVWLAVPGTPDWRWLLRRQDSPWYPTMRLFRQTRLGQWHDVFERMAAEPVITAAVSMNAPLA